VASLALACQSNGMPIGLFPTLHSCGIITAMGTVES
jgi:hypothetical protein